jgi:hypothetical protein
MDDVSVDVVVVQSHLEFHMPHSVECLLEVYKYVVEFFLVPPTFKNLKPQF